VYRWELDGPAQQQFGDLSPAVRVTLAAFLDAVVIVDPVQYQRRPDEREGIPMPLRTLHFGRQDEGPLPNGFICVASRGRPAPNGWPCPAGRAVS
jgi:hypothetical protein